MTEQDLVSFQKKWKNDPVSFAEDMFGIKLDPWQKNGLTAILNNQRTAFKASKGVGKLRC